MRTLLLLAALAAAPVPAAAADVLAPYVVDGDAIREPIGNARGEPGRGRALVLAREPANCLLCHAVPDRDIRFAGDVGPSLAGVGARLTAAQLRLRIVNSTLRDRDSMMPAYYRVDGLHAVAPAWRGRPILDAQQVEDLVAYLATLR